MLTIGILGTAKNTGKTTVLNSALKCLSDLKVGITSIGFDGEDFDFVTGLPKPKVVVDEGTIVLTSKKAAQTSTAKLELLKSLKLKTPMGEIGVYKVKEIGNVALVGPNSSDDLLFALSKLEEYKLDVLLVDGAANRMMPFQHVDYVVIATGAARTTDLRELFLETKVLVNALQLPKGDSKPTVQGFVNVEKLKEYENQRITVESPFHLLVASDVKVLDDLLSRLKIHVLRRPNLLCVAVNPCYPERRVEGYALSEIDLTTLTNALRSQIGIITVDVEHDETEFCQILQRLFK